MRRLPSHHKEGHVGCCEGDGDFDDVIAEHGAQPGKADDGKGHTESDTGWREGGKGLVGMEE